MADNILHTYKNRISALTLIPSSGGVFEVRVDDALIHSKRETDRFPDEEQIVAAVGERAG